ncbi:MAG: RNA polymerase sigma factor [Sneathiella sp.]|nr:RNA polymerase sigma factor [Sneathiella sp.]
MYNSSLNKSWIDIYLNNKSQIELFFRQRIDNPEDCKDLEQELYIRIHKLDPDKQVEDRRAYLFRIAHNLINDLLRWRQRSHYQNTENDALQEVRDDTYRVDDQVSDRQRLALLREAIDHLSPKSKEVFLLRKVEDIPNREIAERLGISQNMVEKHLRKALGELKKYLSDKEKIQH